MDKSAAKGRRESMIYIPILAPVSPQKYTPFDLRSQPSLWKALFPLIVPMPQLFCATTFVASRENIRGGNKRYIARTFCIGKIDGTGLEGLWNDFEES